MQNIVSTKGLKDAIQVLESEQGIKAQRLKDQFYLTFEMLKPVNLISSTINDITKSPFLVDNILGTAMGLASGYLSKRLFIGASGNKIRRLLGLVLQFGITNIVAQNSETIKSFGSSLLSNFFHKREMNTEKL